MESLSDLVVGFSHALSPENLLFALIGCLIGTMIGVLPGIGPTAGIALLIPLTYSLDPASAIIMLAAIYYGTAYGGTITAVLLNIPGETESAITCIDGYQMTVRGRAGIALMVAGLGSFVGGTLATIGLVAAAEPLSRLGLMIGPPEFLGLVLVGIALLVGLVGKSVLLGAISAVLGILIAMVGIDPVAGLPRFTFGNQHLLDGIPIIAVLVGIFGLGELLDKAGSTNARPVAPRLREMLPTRTDIRRSSPPIGRGTAIGFFIGLIPGVSNAISSLISYSSEKKVSKYRHELGRGAIEGVAGPETANNAHLNASLVPMFTLGIPASPAIAVLMGAFLANGLTPGPRLFDEAPVLAWTIIASLFVGNFILFLLNVPLVGLWTRLLAVPYSVLAPALLVFIVLGTYSVRATVFDVFVMVFFGIVGLVMRRTGIPPEPLVLTLILGPLLEGSLRQSLQISQGSFMVFVQRPIALGFIIMATAIIALSVVWRSRQQTVIGEVPSSVDISRKI